MKCDLCGFEFEEAEAAKGCAGCGGLGGCGLIRCPNCGYEWPTEPTWLQRLKGYFKRKKRHASEPQG
jgi:rubredoxin